MLDNNLYLTDMPQEFEKHGMCKVLNVRVEVIHLKHILTEIFTRKSINIQYYLDKLGMDLFSYMEYMTNRLRWVHHFPRQYSYDINAIVKSERTSLFDTVKMLEGHNLLVSLDFDGVVTDKRFHRLYNLMYERFGKRLHITTANPTVTMEWFDGKGLPRPAIINSMKGKVGKIKKLIELQKKHDYVFHIDNEEEYLEYAFIFGLETFHWDGRGIKKFSMKTK